MNQFKIYTIESALPESKNILNRINEAMGFIPNMLGIFAEAPVVLGGSFALFGHLGKGELSPIEQQIVAITISRENNCHYCVAAHSTFAVGANMPLNVLTEVRAGKILSDTKLEVLRTITTKLLSEKGWLSLDDQNVFFKAGYKEAHLFEVIAWIGLKTITNYINHIASTPVDQVFAAQKWEG